MLNLKELAQKINANYWSKNNVERAYISYGFNTAQTQTKCWIELDQNNRPRIMVKVDNESMGENWCKGIAKKFKEELLEIYGEILSENELEPIEVNPYEWLRAKKLPIPKYQRTPLPHQIAAFEKLIDLRCGFLIFDMGTGKTFTSIMFADARFEAHEIKRVVYLTKNSVISNTALEVQNNSKYPHIYHFFGAESVSSSPKTQDKIIQIVENFPTMIILDESDMWKNGDTVRFDFLCQYNVLEKTKFILLMTGTAATKNIADFYYQFMAMDFGSGAIIGLPSYDKFENQYVILDASCLGKARRPAGYKNLAHLFSRLSPYIHQVRKEDVFEVTDKFFTVKTSFLSPYQMKLLRAEERKINEWNAYSVMNFIQKSQQIASGFLFLKDEDDNKELLEFESEKYQILQNVLSENPSDKHIIFCTYQYEVEKIKNMLGESCLAYYKDAKFSPRVEFKKDKYQYLVMTYSKGNAGLDLSFCNRMVFFSPTFDLKFYLQAQDRIHRIGQNSPCYYTHILGGVDTDKIYEKCIYRKENLFYEVIKSIITNQSFENV